MRLARYLIAVMAGISLVFAHSVTAVAFVFPGQHDAPAIVNELASHADQFWAERGIVGNCPITGATVWQAKSLLGGDGVDAWGRGDGSTCEFWVSDSLVGFILNPYRLDDAVNACQAIVHEDGHARGLPHSQSGVMAGPGPWGAPDAEPYKFAWAPEFCIRWGRAWFAEQLRGLGASERTIKRTIARELRDS